MLVGGARGCRPEFVSLILRGASSNFAGSFPRQVNVAGIKDWLRDSIRALST